MPQPYYREHSLSFMCQTLFERAADDLFAVSARGGSQDDIPAQSLRDNVLIPEITIGRETVDAATYRRVDPLASEALDND
jgi:hypothetical protein